MIVPPLFLSREFVLRVHRVMIERYGGSAELRDAGLLESAPAMPPSSSFGGEFLHPDLPAMGAAYLFHLVQNHPFVDGNKRVGATSARAFMGMNDARFDPLEADYEALVFGVARGEISKNDVTLFFQRHTRV